MTSYIIRAVIFGLVGLVLAVWATSTWLQGRRTFEWPSTPGVITESHGSSPHKPAVDGYHLSYTYTAGGAARVGHKLQLGHEGNEGTFWAQRYRVGQPVPVYVAPGDPDLAVLRRGAPPFEVGLKAALSLGLLLLASAFVRRGLRVGRAGAEPLSRM